MSGGWLMRDPDMKTIWLVIFFIMLLAGHALPACAFDPTPLRVAYMARGIHGEKTTLGLDLGILQAATHRVAGVQFAPSAIVRDLYGVQIGLFQASIEGQGYGVQIAGITTFANTAHTFYGMQLGVMANNFSFDRTSLEVAGIQAAMVLNLAGNVKGLQVGAINASYNITGLQLGLYNELKPEPRYANLGMQVGGYNTSTRMSGVQLGVSNFAEEMRGVQIGFVNRALKLKGVQLGLINILSEVEKPNFRVLPILNVSW